MKKIKFRVSRRQLIWGTTALASLLIGLIFGILRVHMTSGLLTQKMADRWSNVSRSAQISCFFAESAQITEESLMQFEYNLNKGLEEASIVSESENENARLWADAYSAKGTVTIESDKSKVDVTAIGIGGDFFQFHPVTLKSGSYFSGNDLMQDHVIIDEQAAWQLFGSNDVAGQIVYISGIPHVVAGVTKREEGRMAEAAGLSSSIAYVSYQTLSQYGTSYGINCYEVVMPNPVKGYAKQFVGEHIGVTENDVEVIENTTRFQFLNLFKQFTQFGTRSMSSKAIIYPYWENMARGYEDIAVLLLTFELLFILYPAIFTVVVIILAWKHKKWTARSVWNSICDFFSNLSAKCRQKRKEKKAEKEKGILKEGGEEL